MVVANGASDNAVAHLQRHPDLYLIADTPKGEATLMAMLKAHLD